MTAYDGSCSILKPLRGREVVLFPDLGAEDSWTTKMLTLRKQGIDCAISSLKGIASEEDVANGFDLADYLLKWPVTEFQSWSQSDNSTDIAEWSEAFDSRGS